MRHLHSGKVRDLYEVDDLLLMVATDRISAYDWVLASEIPDKGRVLTALSVWWFERLAGVVPNHLVSYDDPRIPPEWRGRALLVQRLDMVPVECVARGYLAGSGWVEYQRSRTVCGVALPDGLLDGSRLPGPVFTPTTKGPVGEHDQAMSYDDVVAAVGADTAAALRDLTLAAYLRGAAVAEQRGLILADTKFEFGRATDGRLTLGDEVLTPDSSRYWPRDGWRPGGGQPSYDKQYVRDWLRAHWDPTSSEPPPSLPDDVVAATRTRYVEAYERLTATPFAQWRERFGG